jgi:hypothetical protein
MTIIDNRTTNLDLALPHADNLLADDVARLRESFTTIDTLAAPLASPLFTGNPKAPTPTAGDNDTSIATTAFVQAEIAPKAPLASPALTGTPTAPTPTASDNSTTISTTAFVKTAVANLVASAPGALDTLNELATALGNDPNFATSMTNALALKAPLASPALTGNPTAPTPAGGDNDTSIATTAFVQGEIAPKAPIASPTFTGDPKAPTPTKGDADTSIATTAFVQAEGKQYASTYNISSAATLTSAHFGSLVYFSAGGYSVTLPAVGTNKTLTLLNGTTSAVVTLAAQGASNITNAYPLSNAASFVLNPGDKVELTCDGTNWIVSAWRQRNNPEFFAATLLGDCTAVTQATSDNSTKLSTTAFVKAVVAALVNSSPSTLDTLNELATALGNDPNFATTMTSALAAKAPLASPTFTGGMTLADTSAVFSLKDTNSVVGAMLAYLSFKDSTGTEQGWIGYGAGNGELGINNGARNINIASPINSASSITTTGGFLGYAASAGGIALSLNGGGTYHIVPLQLGGVSKGYIATTASGIELWDSTSSVIVRVGAGSCSLGGQVTAPTASGGNSSTVVATTAFVQGEISAKAPLASPVFTGNPTAPTPSAGDNDTSVATTAFVQGEIAGKMSSSFAGKTTIYNNATGVSSIDISSSGWGLYLVKLVGLATHVMVPWMGVASTAYLQVSGGNITSVNVNAAGVINSASAATTGTGGGGSANVETVYKLG